MVIEEMQDALTDPSFPVENAISLGAVEMWDRTNDPIWIRVWVELNASQYVNTRQFARDMLDIFSIGEQ